MAAMTTEQFDQAIGHLIKIVLPPSCDDDPPIIAEAVIEILEAHIETIRSTIIRYGEGD
jgi:hypothetical protein